MSPDPADMTHDYPFPTTQEYRRRSPGLVWNLVLFFLIFLYVILLALPALSTDAIPGASVSINRSLPGSSIGILTSAQGPAVRIDRDTYTLTPFALVEDKFGTPLSVNDLKWNDVEFRVQYWIARDLGPNHIMQLIINFPE